MSDLICVSDKVRLDTGEIGVVHGYTIHKGEIKAKIKLNNGETRHRRKDQLKRVK